MTRERILITLSVLLIISPFLGLPYSWLRVVVVVLGILCGLTALSIKRIRTRASTPSVSHEQETLPLS